MQDELAKAWIEYWQLYSLGTWQFWLHLVMLITQTSHLKELGYRLCL